VASGKIFFDMSAPRFVHLRLHSEYSVSDGIVRLDQVVSRAAADGMPALALTDLANLFGLVKFYGAARAAGLKPIIGADCWLQNPGDRDKPQRLLQRSSMRTGLSRSPGFCSQQSAPMTGFTPAARAAP